MNLLSNIKSVFVPSASENNFYIYTNAVLNPPSNVTNNTAAQAIRFTNLYDVAYKNQVNVAYEPLENSQFSSDSYQDTPFTLFLTGIVSPIALSATYNNANYIQELQNTSNQLEQYLESTTLLTVVQSRPLFRQYANMKLISVSYSLDPNHTNLVAYLSLQEIRMTNTVQSGQLQQNQVANPANSSQVDNGQQLPQTPTTNTSNNILAG